MKSIFKVLFILFVLRLVYSEFFATHIELVNKTNYDLYTIKGEFRSKSIEPSMKEIDNQQRLIIKPNTKESYSVRFHSQVAQYPVDISASWDTRIYDDNGDSISVMESQSSLFKFSEDGFCDYEIIIHEQYAEARGFNKNFCYRKILLHASRNIIITP